MTGDSDTWRLGYRPALDGVRGAAIALVVAGHAQLLPGVAGPIGVTVFFALSGFLITSLLIEEWESNGHISLTRFYGRRARRLFPALGAYLGVSLLLTVAGVSIWAFPIREYVGPLFYMENWLMALRGGAPHVTGITWSLAIEEQFYLVWPLLLIAAAIWGSRRLLVGVTVAGIVLAPALRLLLWDGGVGQWRIYYGTDTRMDCLLIGCLLAVVVNRAGVPGRVWHWWPTGALLVSTPFLGGASVHLWLPTVVAAGACVVIAASLGGGASWLTATPLRWLGRRSYALYLWHYPLVYVFARDLGAVPMWLAVGLSLALAEASWWLVERPFMRRRSADFSPAPPQAPSPVAA